MIQRETTALHKEKHISLSDNTFVGLKFKIQHIIIIVIIIYLNRKSPERLRSL